LIAKNRATAANEAAGRGSARTCLEEGEPNMSKSHSITRRSFVGTAAAGATALALPGTVLAQAKDSLVMGWPVDPPTWDPVVRTNPGIQSIYKMIFDQPLTQAPDLKVVAAVVKAWKLSDDGKRVDLELRDDVVWHDGEKLTTADVRYTYLERKQKGEKLDIATVWRNLTDVQVESPTKCAFILSAPMPTAIPWMAFLANFIVPKHYVEKVGPEKFGEQPIGSGPYKLVSYERNSRIVLEAFDKYWGPKPSIKKITILIMKDVSARVAAIQSGQADWVPEIPIRDVARLAAMKGFKAEAQPITRIILLQIRSDQAFADKNVRLAAHHAIDKAALSRAMFAGKAVPLSVITVPGTPSYDPSFKFAYDQKLAKELLAKSGFSPQKPITIGMATTNGYFPGDYDMARAIAQMWKAVGIEAKIEVIEQTKYFELNRANKLPEATLYTWDNATGDPEMFAGYLLHPKLPFSSWKDMGVGERIMKLFGTVNYDERIAGYKDIEKYAVNEGAAMPLLQTVLTRAYKSDLKIVEYANGWSLPQTWSWT
jgi:peptide/nickel transport system substrate-binding protein